MKIRIAIAEDHELVRQGMVSLAKRESKLTMVFDVANGEELLHALRTKVVDVVLLDLNMPKISGQQALKVISEKYPDVRVIIVSMLYDDLFIAESVELGARGFLPKNVDFEKVVDAIYSVHEKGYYFDQRLTKALLMSVATNKGKKPLNSSYLISTREVDILGEICNGKSNQQIAKSFSISIRTVETHKRNLLRKTKTNNVASLVVFAIKNGLFVVASV